MSRPGTCELGCGEELRLDLVAAAAHDELDAYATAARARAAAFRAVAERLAREPPGPGGSEVAYRSVQEAARATLRAHPDPGEPETEAAAVATTWWCPRCGGVDAPQPCLGICVWRPFEWVPADRYDDARARAGAARHEERRLRALLRRTASITPRAGEWERTWRALAADAVLRVSPDVPPRDAI